MVAYRIQTLSDDEISGSLLPAGPSPVPRICNTKEGSKQELESHGLGFSHVPQLSPKHASARKQRALSSQPHLQSPMSELREYLLSFHIRSGRKQSPQTHVDRRRNKCLGPELVLGGRLLQLVQ